MPELLKKIEGGLDDENHPLHNNPGMWLQSMDKDRLKKMEVRQYKDIIIRMTTRVQYEQPFSIMGKICKKSKEPHKARVTSPFLLTDNLGRRFVTVRFTDDGEEQRNLPIEWIVNE